tara:strand:- start:8110 stop:9219 length:1110 start_codon:yes stop_codon:yes gene_type:complete
MASSPLIPDGISKKVQMQIKEGTFSGPEFKKDVRMYHLQMQMNILNNTRINVMLGDKPLYQKFLDSVVAKWKTETKSSTRSRAELLKDVMYKGQGIGKLQTDFINSLEVPKVKEVPKVVPVDVKEIPDKLENIQSAKNVEFWLENASKCRAKIDKDSFDAGKRIKIIFDRITKRDYNQPLFFTANKTEVYLRDPKKETIGQVISPEQTATMFPQTDGLWYISLQGSAGGGHANLVLIRKGKLYRFDPHGREIAKESYKDVNLVLNKFLKDVSKLLGLDYVPTEESCPSLKGLQGVAKTISKKGLCNFWTMLVMEILIKNKEMTLTEVLSLFSNMDPTQLSNIIYNFWWEVKEEHETEATSGGRLWIEEN